MARPKKNLSEKHTCVIPPIRCTTSERNDIKAKAKSLGLTMSEYIRRMAIDGKIVKQQSKYDFEFINQIRRIGVNINQQTKRLNGTGEVSPELKSLWSKLNSVLEDILETA